MTIYQQELLRKLPYYDCTGSYSENEESLDFSYNGIKIGWMEKNGSVCGVVDENMPEDADDIFFAIRNQAKQIWEYVGLYESSPPTVRALLSGRCFPFGTGLRTRLIHRQTDCRTVRRQYHGRERAWHGKPVYGFVADKIISFHPSSKRKIPLASVCR